MVLETSLVRPRGSRNGGDRNRGETLFYSPSENFSSKWTSAATTETVRKSRNEQKDRIFKRRDNLASDRRLCSLYDELGDNARFVDVVGELAFVRVDRWRIPIGRPVATNERAPRFTERGAASW